MQDLKETFSQLENRIQILSKARDAWERPKHNSKFTKLIGGIESF